MTTTGHLGPAAGVVLDAAGQSTNLFTELVPPLLILGGTVIFLHAVLRHVVRYTPADHDRRPADDQRSTSQTDPPEQRPVSLPAPGLPDDTKDDPR